MVYILQLHLFSLHLLFFLSNLTVITLSGSLDSIWNSPGNVQNIKKLSCFPVIYSVSSFRVISFWGSISEDIVTVL